MPDGAALGCGRTTGVTVSVVFSNINNSEVAKKFVNEVSKLGTWFHETGLQKLSFLMKRRKTKKNEIVNSYIFCKTRLNTLMII